VREIENDTRVDEEQEERIENEPESDEEKREREKEKDIKRAVGGRRDLIQMEWDLPKRDTIGFDSKRVPIWQRET
jgi:hypothetical protein